METDKSILIVSGLSGAGKHQVLYQLEDLGYFCIDNLPPPLIENSIQSLRKKESCYLDLAIGIDVRGQIFHQELKKSLQQLRKNKINYKIIFLEAKEEELLRRFSETRRPHPFKANQPLTGQIKAEIKKISWLKEQADFVIDTTYLSPPELRRQLAHWVGRDKAGLQITVSSFGFKYGLPNDADMIFDVRFLPNPFYVPRLKKMTGKNREVKKFIMKETVAEAMITQVDQMVRTIKEGFIQEGKHRLHICIGCTGGQHRSVVIADELKKVLPGKVMVHHRELGEGIKD